MTLTVNINGLTLCHKGSRGISRCTLPDVCKTPPNGMPVPYGNTAFSKDLTQGTHSVFADGGNMIAHNASCFASSILDEAGSMGGVVSGVNRARAEWISHSFDVFFERKPACRLTDKMFMNSRNTVNLAGLLQEALNKSIKDFEELICKWAKECYLEHCNRLGSKGSGAKYAHFQDCLNDKIREDTYRGGRPEGRVANEVSFEKIDGKWCPVMSKKSPENFSTNPYTPSGGRRLDIVLSDGDKITRIYDVKFPGDDFAPGQREAYEDIAADAEGDFSDYFFEEECSDWPPECPNEKRAAEERATARQPEEETEKSVEPEETDWLLVAQVVLAVAATVCPLDGPAGDAVAWASVATRLARRARTVKPAF
jgi:hypothetical protein